MGQSATGTGKPATRRPIYRLFGLAFVLLTLALALPAIASASGDWAAVSGGTYHTVALKQDGTLWAWGYNNWSQLGLGDNNNRLAPTQVGGGTNWATVSVGYEHTLAIRKDGTLWAWGENSYGELGIGSAYYWALTPTEVDSGTDWAAVSAGYHHSVALKKDGTLWAWGYNNTGQLGLEDTTNRATPTRVGDDTDWAAVSCSSQHTLALKKDGSLWAWGSNSGGELGLGDTGNRLTPTQVGGGTNWATVSGRGYIHTVALRKDGTLWAWGLNGNGQLGLGDTANRLTPTQVGGANDWASVSGGWYHTLALKKDGSLWVWGSGDAAQSSAQQ